jgi:hypothetical protein
MLRQPQSEQLLRRVEGGVVVLSVRAAVARGALAAPATLPPTPAFAAAPPSTQHRRPPVPPAPSHRQPPAPPSAGVAEPSSLAEAAPLPQPPTHFAVLESNETRRLPSHMQLAAPLVAPASCGGNGVAPASCGASGVAPSSPVAEEASAVAAPSGAESVAPTVAASPLDPTDAAMAAAMAKADAVMAAAEAKANAKYAAIDAGARTEDEVRDEARRLLMEDLQPSARQVANERCGHSPTDSP